MEKYEKPMMEILSIEQELRTSMPCLNDMMCSTNVPTGGGGQICTREAVICMQQSSYQMP
ncbi:MAG: hypothetical protein IJS53_05700 [Clostridia bacterium]|nr:hypothetical protein [Clostridia bacterium]